MTQKFQAKQRVQITKDKREAAIVSRDVTDGEIQVIAPNESYTVKWDDTVQPESMIYPNELEDI